MIPKSVNEIASIKEECRRLVRKKASAAALINAAPISGIEIGAEAAIMLNLIRKINQKFGLSPAQIDSLNSKDKEKILMIIKTVGSKFANNLISKDSVTILMNKTKITKNSKYLPYVGRAFSALLTFSSLTYIGYSHIEECCMICKRLVEVNED